MKLAKKDKVMLLVLGVIMFVAIFFVYMIMPAKDEGKALDAQIATKKTEAQKVATDLAKIDTAKLYQQLDDLYGYYYAQKDKQKDQPNGLHPYLANEVLEQKIKGIFSKPTVLIEGYNPREWSVSKISKPVTGDNNIATTVDMYVVNMPLRFRVRSLRHLENILDYFYNDPYFRINDISIAENTNNDSHIMKPAKPEDERFYIAEPATEEQYQFEVNMKLEFYMGDKYTTDKIPAPLGSTPVEIVEGTKIKFYGVENAIRYELYEFTYNNVGDRAYKKITNVSIAVKEGNAEYEVVVPDAVFNDGKEHNIVVKAIGDQKKGFYATALDSKTPFVVLKK